MAVTSMKYRALIRHPDTHQILHDIYAPSIKDFAKILTTPNKEGTSFFDFLPIEERPTTYHILNIRSYPNERAINNARSYLSIFKKDDQPSFSIHTSHQAVQSHKPVRESKPVKHACKDSSWFKEALDTLFVASVNDRISATQVCDLLQTNIKYVNLNLSPHFVGRLLKFYKVPYSTKHGINQYHLGVVKNNNSDISTT